MRTQTTSSQQEITSYTIKGAKFAIGWKMEEKSGRVIEQKENIP